MPRRERGHGQAAAACVGPFYKAALQHVAVNTPVADRPRINQTFANAVRRCALVQPTCCVVADRKSYPKLATTAQENGTFDNQMEDGVNAGATWSIWLWQYGPAASERMAPCPRRTPATASLDKAKVLPGTRSRVLTGQGHHTRRNGATRHGADGRCTARLSWTRLSWTRRG